MPDTFTWRACPGVHRAANPGQAAEHSGLHFEVQPGSKPSDKWTWMIERKDDRQAVIVAWGEAADDTAARTAAEDRFRRMGESVPWTVTATRADGSGVTWTESAPGPLAALIQLADKHAAGDEVQAAEALTARELYQLARLVRQQTTLAGTNVSEHNRLRGLRDKLERLAAR